MTIIFLIYHFWFQLITIVIPIPAILGFQNSLYRPKPQQTNAMPRSAATFENKFFIKKPFFPVKNKLQTQKAIVKMNLQDWLQDILMGKTMSKSQ